MVGRLRTTGATPTATPLPPGLSADAYRMMAADSRAGAVPAAVPSPPACLPDAPGGVGCPLYVPGTTVIPPDSGVDCAKVCDEYHTCLQPKGAQAGFTCDATLCTDECNDRDLVSIACQGLSGCDISEIVKAETAGELQLLRKPAMRMRSERENQQSNLRAEPTAARSRHHASMRHQRHALRDAVKF